MSIEVPFVCQFATPAHAEQSLRKQLDPKVDPHWQLTGAKNPERYAQWAFTMCGMACTAMALAHFKRATYLPAQLAEDALQHDVYVEDEIDISSMRYAEFSQWIQRLNLHAHVISHLSMRGILYALSNDKLVIVSVNPNIRGYQTAPTDQNGGHLVLVVGYDTHARTISINNPSGFESTMTQVNHALPLDDFQDYFAGRGIILSAI